VGEGQVSVVEVEGDEETSDVMGTEAFDLVIRYVGHILVDIEI
jgi:hypothetical protein